MRSVSVRAFAKLNLGLSILGRRADGFHELRTVYQAISLCDLLEVSIGPKSRTAGVALDLRGLDVPTGRDNLAVRAAESMCHALGLSRQVRIRLRKRIPTGGGLGGGSSDAAAVLRALDRLTGERLDRGKLIRIAAELGSDVPFFLFGGRAIGLGRGEEVYPLPDGQPLHCVLAVPDRGMNTAEAYNLLNAAPWPDTGKVPPSAAKLMRQTALPTAVTFSAVLLVETRAKSPVAGPLEPIGNDFEPIVFRRFPELVSARGILLRSGAHWAALTGSGSAVFGLFVKKELAQTAYRKLKGMGLRSHLCRTVRRREFLLALHSR